MTIVSTFEPAGESNSAFPVSLAKLVSGEELVALLQNPEKFDTLRRKSDLLDVGVAALFGVAGEQAELLAVSFHGGRFSPAAAASWLAERGFNAFRFTAKSSGCGGA